MAAFPRCVSRCLLALALVVGGAFQGAPAAYTATLNWANPAGGAYATPANWAPAQAPTSIDALVFNLNATYGVTAGNTTLQSATQTYRRGSVSLLATSPHTIAGVLQIATTNLDVAALEVVGALAAGSTSQLGAVAGSTGSLVVRGAGSQFQVTGAGQDLRVGSRGVGDLQALDGAAVKVTDDVFIGDDAGSDGGITVSGVADTVASLLQTTGVTGDLFVGEQGSGRLSILAGGRAQARSAIYVGYLSGAFGTLEAGSGGPVSRVTSDGNLYIGANLTTAAAGDGIASAGAGGEFRCAARLQVGDAHGGSGSLLVQGGTVHTQTLAVIPGSGSLALTGGTLRVDGGTLDLPDPLVLGASVGSGRGALELIRGAVGTVAGPLTLVGTAADTAALVLASGAHLTVGGALVATDGVAAIDADSSATLSVQGPLFLGAEAAATVTNEATLALTDSLELRGRLRLDGGTLVASRMRFAAAGRLEARGVLAVPIAGDSAGTTIAALADLDLGVAADPAGYAFAGTLEVGAHHVRLLAAADIALGDSTRLEGGTLEVADTLSNPAAAVLAGRGTLVAAHFENDGVLDVGEDAASDLFLAGGGDLGTTSELLLDVAGALGGEFDRVVVAGALTCGGKLRLRIAPGLNLPAGAELPLLTAGTRTGVFESLVLEGDTTGTSGLALDYTDSTVVLLVPKPVSVPQWNDTPADFALTPLGGRSPAFVLALPEAGRVQVDLFSVTGRRVRTLLHAADLPGGQYHVAVARSGSWSGGLAPGLYFARATFRTRGNTVVCGAELLVR